MSYKTRVELYKQIEEKRKKPLISYITSTRIGCSASMTQDVLPFFIHQVERIVNSSEYSECKEVDVLIISNGGDAIVSWRIISLLREFFEKVNVLIPYTAYSAATLVALGANDIIMHPFGNLGPVDPQITIRKQGSQRTIGYEDIVKYMEFVKGIGITDQSLIHSSFDKLASEIDPVSLGFAKRSSQLSLDMSEKLLSLHMNDKNKAKGISEILNTKFYSHGYSLGKKEAKEIGLNIIEDAEIEKLSWLVTKDFMDELCMNQPINIQSYLQSKLDISSLETKEKREYRESFDLVYLESLCDRDKYLIEYTVVYFVDEKLELNMNFNVIGKWAKEE